MEGVSCPAEALLLSTIGQAVREKPRWRRNSTKFEGQCCMEARDGEMVTSEASKKGKGGRDPAMKRE
jgi:hypothetical protein